MAAFCVHWDVIKEGEVGNYSDNFITTLGSACIQKSNPEEGFCNWDYRIGFRNGC